ncbi:MAG TPA: helix-turn-helix domain-containing protein [Solirubrobacteraceae bacterium]|jgi:excisionase family DNA binding protein
MSTEPFAVHLALLKPSELAAQLGVSRSWLYDAAKTGRIPSIRIGGEEGPLRFVSEDIRRWIDDARATWSPGRPTVPTGRPGTVDGRSQNRRSPRPQTLVNGQQRLL